MSNVEPRQTVERTFRNRNELGEAVERNEPRGWVLADVREVKDERGGTLFRATFRVADGIAPPSSRPDVPAAASGISWKVAAAIVAGVLVIGAGAWYLFRPAETATVHGTFSLIGAAPFTPCRGSGGYSDINEGTEVRLKADEKMLDVTRLGPGRPAGTTCVFDFQLAVPKGRKFYTVEVGRRGEFSYTWDEVRRPGAIALVLGSP